MSNITVAMTHDHRSFAQLASVPILETGRLILSAHTVDDFDAMVERWSDPAVVKFIGPPSRPRDAWMRMLHFRGLWALLGVGYWAVREKDSLRCIGDVGFGDMHRDIHPCIDGIPEAGWVFSRDAHGKGYAVEAVGAALAWLERAVPCEKTVCLIDPRHSASLRVASRLGYADPCTVRFNGEDSLLLTRPRGVAAGGH
jgi:RimJ/RimL family protein N-acetyltransferase